MKLLVQYSCFRLFINGLFVISTKSMMKFPTNCLKSWKMLRFLRFLTSNIGVFSGCLSKGMYVWVCEILFLYLKSWKLPRISEIFSVSSILSTERLSQKLKIATITQIFSVYWWNDKWHVEIDLNSLEFLHCYIDVFRGKMWMFWCWCNCADTSAKSSPWKLTWIR